MLKIKKGFFIFFFLTVFFTVSFSGIGAIEYNFLGGKPAYPDPDIPNSSSWFIYNVDKGESREDTVLVMNNFEETLDILVYAADSVKSSSGGFALKQLAEEQDKVGSWVKFYPNPVPEVFKEIFEENDESIVKFCSLNVTNEKELFENWCEGVSLVELTLEAKEKREIDFVFSVPEDVDIGEHTGGILIQKAEIERDLSEEQGIAITTRVGVRIYQTVPGDIVKKIELRKFHVARDYKEFDYKNFFSRDKRSETISMFTEVENLGNVSVDFTETITIIDELFDKKSEEIKGRGFQVLRDDTFISSYSWNNPRFGKFTFISNIGYVDEEGESHNVTSEPVTIVILPLRESLLAFLIVVLIFTPIIVSKLKRKKIAETWVPYTVQAGVTFDTIVNKLGVNWKTFAKVNGLKPPYTLRAGQKILLPPKKR